MSRAALWTKDFVLLCSVMFFVSLTFYLLMTTMALYATGQFSATPSQAGMAVGIFILGALAARPLAGRYMEVIGRKRLLQGSLFTASVAMLLYFPARNLGMLLAIRFFHGMAFGIINTALTIAIVDLLPRERRGEGVGYFSSSATVAAAFGPLLGMFLQQHGNAHVTFTLCTAAYLLSIVAIFFAYVPEVSKATEPDALRGTGWHGLVEPSAIPISVVMLLVCGAYASLLAFLGPYAVQIRLIAPASFFFLVCAVFILLSRPFTGRLLDRRGDNVVMYPALLIFALSLAVLSLAHGAFALLLAGALTGLGFGTIMSSTQVIASKHAPPHRLALATATFYLIADIGMGGGPPVVGKIIPAVGFRNMFLMLALTVFLSVILYHLLYGRRQKWGTIGESPQMSSSQQAPNEA